MVCWKKTFVKQLKIKQNNKKEDFFLGMLLGTLDSSLLGNLSAGKWTIIVDEGTIRVGQDF